jgi:putative pyruvate formate lyase activating enzyme
MRFVAQQVSPDSYVNVMGQYYPAGKVSGDKYAEINRRASSAEVRAAMASARAAGLTRFDERPAHPMSRLRALAERH